MTKSVVPEIFLQNVYTVCVCVCVCMCVYAFVYLCVCDNHTEGKLVVGYT